jgi:parallel beta-helix repeat protein
MNSEVTGIHLYGVFFSNIYRNNITSSGVYGMDLDESEHNTIFENNIKYNKQYGMHLWDSRNNLIYHNNFIANHPNAFCDGAQTLRWNDWNLGYTKDGGGNYWSDYKGKDNNDDGVGDTPYIIPDDNPFYLNNKDQYPLMEPDGRPNYRVRTHKCLGFIERCLNRFPNSYPIMRYILDQ